MGCCTSKSSENADNMENQANARLGIDYRVFFVDELAAATNNFNDGCLLGRGRFGPVFAGILKRPDEIVAIKKIHNVPGQQSYEAFLTEARMLVELRHPNIVRTIGYTAQAMYRYLVLEYLPLGSLDDHLFSRNSEMVPLDWNARMKIALCVAQGLEYLHLRQDPPIIHRNLKCSNILLAEGYHAKLSVFGLAKEGQAGHEPHATTSAVGSSRYIAPEYARTGRLTIESDIHGFGVVLFEILTGRRFGEFNNGEAQDFVALALPNVGQEDFLIEIADVFLQGKFPIDEFAKAASLMVKCVQANADRRPRIDEIVNDLTNLSHASIQ